MSETIKYQAEKGGEWLALPITLSTPQLKGWAKRCNRGSGIGGKYAGSNMEAHAIRWPNGDYWDCVNGFKGAAASEYCQNCNKPEPVCECPLADPRPARLREKPVTRINETFDVREKLIVRKGDVYKNCEITVFYDPAQEPMIELDRGAVFECNIVFEHETAPVPENERDGTVFNDLIATAPDRVWCDRCQRVVLSDHHECITFDEDRKAIKRALDRRKSESLRRAMQVADKLDEPIKFQDIHK